MVASWLVELRGGVRFFFLFPLKDQRGLEHVKYWWERGSREEQLELQGRGSFWSEVPKGGSMSSRDRRRDGSGQGWGWWETVRRGRGGKVELCWAHLGPFRD